MTSDEEAIRALVAAWMDASKMGDLETLSGLMADDVLFLSPGQEPCGKDGFLAAARRMKDLHIEGTSEIEELKIFGDWAYMRNRLTITVLTENGDPMLRRSGYTLSILRKKPDGRWVLSRDANLLGKQS